VAHPIARVSRFSTGTVDVHPQHAYRGRSPMYWWILTSRRWLTGRPINVYVVEHRDGLVLFDTGQDRASVTDPCYFPRGAVGVIYRRLARFQISESETLSAGLTRLGYRPADVTKAVISHLHQDHIGGVREIPGAELLVSGEEWRSLHRPMAEARGLLRDHIDVPGLKWSPVDFTALNDPSLAPFTTGHDVFGDGTLVLLPTPGHTRGSMSMLVRRAAAAPLLLVGDVTYDIHAFNRGQTGGVGSRRQLRASGDKLRALRTSNPGMQLLAAHDPAAAELFESSTLPVAMTDQLAHVDRGETHMGTFQLGIFVNRSPADVFAFVAEPRNMPLWYDAIDAVTTTTNGPAGAGTRFGITRSLPGGQAHNDVEVTEHQPDRRVTLESTAGPTPFRYRYLLEPNGQGTRLTLDGRISSAGLPAPMGRLDGVATQLFKRGMQQNLNELKRTLEARPH
jgi:N-acyl homoserine lactone hydrolase